MGIYASIRNRFRFGLRERYRDLRERARCYYYDARRADGAMNWKRGRDRAGYERASAELFFWYHKLEKGMCLPEPRRFFGADAARETSWRLEAWEARGFPQSDPVYAGAIETLAGYRAIVAALPEDNPQRTALLALIDARIEGRTRADHLSTPVTHATPPGLDIAALEALALTRRSMRNFDGAPVPIEAVERAARVAQLAPSACNRQSTRLHIFTDPERVQALLKLQNGNSGFNHTIPMLVLVTGDAACFKDASERSQLYVDAGLFLMGFLYGLQSQGLSSCCLNWCVTPERDREAMALAGIPENEWIVTFLAIGKASPGALVPRSPRRATEGVVIRHDAPAATGEVAIFSYGTLQMPRVQQELLGRLVAMDDDALLGFDTVPVEIDHPDVIEFSGSATHLGLVPGAPDARIDGKLLHVTAADLPALDDYEGDEYRRVEVTLASGKPAWVYVKA